MTPSMESSFSEQAIDRVMRSIRALFDDSGNQIMPRGLAAANTGFCLCACPESGAAVLDLLSRRSSPPTYLFTLFILVFVLKDKGQARSGGHLSQEGLVWPNVGSCSSSSTPCPGNKDLSVRQFLHRWVFVARTRRAAVVAAAAAASAVSLSA